MALHPLIPLKLHYSSSIMNSFSFFKSLLYFFTQFYVLFSPYFIPQIGYPCNFNGWKLTCNDCSRNGTYSAYNWNMLSIINVYSIVYLGKISLLLNFNFNFAIMFCPSVSVPLVTCFFHFCELFHINITKNIEYFTIELFSK